MPTHQTEKPDKQEAQGRPSQYDCYNCYFTEFLPAIVGQLLMENLRGLTCQVEIAVTDSGDPPWCLTVEQGRLTRVTHDGPDPQCRYVLDLDTLIDVVSAKCSPQDAFFEMRIEIEGDIERGLEISTALAAFFERFPFLPRRGS